MSFKKLEITKKGKELLAKASEGKTIMFTGLDFGDGEVQGTSFNEFEHLIENGLISSKLHTDVDVKRLGDKVKVEGSFKNKEEGFYWREIGVWAMTPDDSDGEILFAYQNAGTLAEFIPSTTSEIVEKIVTVEFEFDAAANVEIKLEDSIVHVTKKEFETKIAELDKRIDIKIAGTVPDIIFETLYPVGAVFITTNDFDPSLILGEWERIEGRYLLATPKQVKAGKRSEDEIDASGWGIEIPTQDLPFTEDEVQIGKGTPAKLLRKKDNVQDSIYVEATPPWFSVNIWHRIK